MEQITIRRWRSSDAAALAALLSNPHILENLNDGLPYPYEEADAEAYIGAMLDAAPDRSFAFAVCVDDTAVGSISAFRQANVHRRCAELGYYLSEDCWGHGIMTQAVRLICTHIFTHSDIIRISAEVFAPNLASRRVLEKAGFSLEGILAQSAVKSGCILDTCLYARLRD